MGRLSDGFSHPTSVSNIIPLRSNDILEVPPLSNPSPSGDILIEWSSANSGFDPTTNGCKALSEMETDERQEGAKEPMTDLDTFNTHSLNNSVLNDNIVSHSSSLFTDKQQPKNLNISQLTLFSDCELHYLFRV